MRHVHARRLAARATQAAVALATVVGLATPAHAVFYTATWQGTTHTLTNVPNQTVEGFSDATLVGQVTNFQTDNPTYSCLNGRALNVWTAPAEFPGRYVVHNGLQGSQCVYGTWGSSRRSSTGSTCSSAPTR